MASLGVTAVSGYRFVAVFFELSRFQEHKKLARKTVDSENICSSWRAAVWVRKKSLVSPLTVDHTSARQRPKRRVAILLAW